MRKCPNKHVHGLVKGLTNAYRSSSRWHTRAWAQAVIRGVESDAVKRHEAYPAEDVEMDLTGADIPDDEFPEEPHVEEVRVPKEIPNAVKLGNHAYPTRTWDTPARNCFVALCELVERTRSQVERRMNSQVRRLCGEQTSEKSLAFEVGRHIHRIQPRCRSGSLCTRGLKRTSV